MKKIVNFLGAVVMAVLAACFIVLTVLMVGILIFG